MRKAPQTNGSKAIGYVRISKAEAEQLGPAVQREAMQRWAAANGVELVSVFEDLGISGGAPLDKRPGLADALVALEDQRAGVLIVAKRDRLARDAMTAGVLHRQVEALGARIVCADGVANGSDPADVLMRQLLDSFAEYERAIIRARTRAALALKRARGEATGGPAPYGYRKANGRLEPVATEQATLTRVAALKAEGLSLRAIAETLAGAGIMSRTGRPFAPVQVARMAVRH